MNLNMFLDYVITRCRPCMILLFWLSILLGSGLPSHTRIGLASCPTITRPAIATGFGGL